MATSTAQLDNCDMGWIDKEISDSVIYNNRFVPAIPGWVAVRGREEPESVIDVFVSPRAHCVLLLSTVLGSVEVYSLRPNDSCMIPHTGVTHRLTFENFRYRWGSPELFYAKALLWEDVHRSGKMESKLPARILDVGEEVSYDVSPSRGSQQVRLVESKKESRGAYMTLSHRWSSVDPITTTRSNIERHRQAIQWKDLSPTFKEAIIVCRDIGVRYLWIDSLCIVQDDEVDWARQSKLMGDIYHKSICTIACHAAEKNDKGFLDRTFDKGSVIVQGKHETAFGVSLPSEFSRAVVYDSVLNWRGWVLQERLLSTRIIHFMKSQMYFESQGDNVIALDTMKSNYLDTTPGILSPHLLSDIAWSGLFNKQVQQWHRIVEWYSYCSLTLEKDKLPALAGIATMIQRQSHDDYFAGLWGHTFYEDLLWVVADGFRSRRPMSPRAPSWSWASLDGPVTYLSHRSKD
ncbi:Ff.00g021170.m01.CDS01 [Fusarium sp. VM40]|nr:Ff.00g021170.m01.CDS01 [Fusarium sp. VM40]